MLLFVLSFLGVTFAHADGLDSWVGSYVKSTGSTIGAGPVSCPDTIRVTRPSPTSVVMESSRSDFNAQYSFGQMNEGYFGCKNKGNPFSNQCYRTRFKQSVLSSDEGSVTNLVPEAVAPMKVERTWSMTKKDNTLKLAYVPSEAVGGASSTCVYRSQSGSASSAAVAMTSVAKISSVQDSPELEEALALIRDSYSEVNATFTYSESRKSAPKNHFERCRTTDVKLAVNWLKDQIGEDASQKVLNAFRELLGGAQIVACASASESDKKLSLLSFQDSKTGSFILFTYTKGSQSN